MRFLTKGPAPNILAQKSAQWHKELLEIIAKGEKPTEAIKARYRHHEIKTAVVGETHGKCAYCESKIRHIAHGDIEHIVPKSKVPEKAYAWENLTLACDICNENKGDYLCEDGEDDQEGLIDPYVDNPSDHFLFLREVVAPRPDSMRAFATEAIIKLRRNELLERRRERMDFIDGLVRAYITADEKYKSLLIDDLHNNHLKDSDEFASSSKQYVGQLKDMGVIK